MTSFIDSLAASEKAVIVIDIGQAYTKFGFAGSSSPHHIIPTRIIIDGKTKSVFEYNSNSMMSHDDRLTELIRLIFYKYSLINCRDRRIVIVESVITPTRIRHLLADILLKQFEAISLVFIPSHLSATCTSGRNTALVLDVGYKETQIMPVAEGIPLAIQFDSLSCAGQAIHKEFACEILFEENIDGKSIVTLILDTLLQAPIDLRQQLADNILIIGGTAIMPGFLHRFNAELNYLINQSPYINRLAIKQFKFHSPPGQLNYIAWLGGSIFGALDTLEDQSITRSKYLENGIVPDWFTGESI
ncbi:unnamed protein product [Adineta steineri]|uniref:Actin-related protein 10 n=1 Tax=Adineta steineri TaxID=433720 RepID=A0A813RHR9_9BILA|nr:unnamed protein product [Adineta steineri]CAF0935681.1 unnamed protein product [Adineta steineri]